jgi:hypothetical protein
MVHQPHKNKKIKSPTEGGYNKNYPKKKANGPQIVDQR